jgi:hypothetical protein
MNYQNERVVGAVTCGWILLDFCVLSTISLSVWLDPCLATFCGFLLLLLAPVVNFNFFKESN